MAKPGGRKPLKPRLKLSKLIGIKFTPDEYRRLRKAAGDIPISTFARERLIEAIEGGKPKGQGLSVAEAKQVIRQVEELRADVERLTKEVEAEMKKAGTDGYWLLDLVTERGPSVARALPEVTVLEQVLSQQYERQEGQVCARKPPIRGKKQSRARTNHKHGMRKNAVPSGLATERK